MTVPVKKPERKWLDWSVHANVDQTESRTKPVAEDRKHPRFACKTPKQRYSVPKKQFYFYYRLQGEGTVRQFFPTPEMSVGLSDMFRNEKPIRYNTDGKYFVTGPEPVGEEETSP